MQHKLFSLNISLKIEDLIITTIYCDKKVDFNRLRESLRKGDYRFFSPIGLVSVLTDRSFYIICPKNIEDINGQIEKVNFTISKDKNRILLKDSSFWVNTNLMVWEGLCDFLLTLNYINANTFGYDNPRNVRSFFNK